MKKLWVYMKDYAKESILGPLFKLLEASFELFVPLVMAAIIDTGIANGDKGYIFKMCGVLIGLAIIGLVCSITAPYFAAKSSRIIEFDITPPEKIIGKSPYFSFANSAIL